jgi:hypothetical protein
VPILVFFHGWYGCLKVLLGADHAPCRPDQPTRYAMDLLRQFDDAGVDALLVVPQLAFDVASSAPGGLARKGQFGALLREILAHPDLASHLAPDATPGRLILAAHSGAYTSLGRALGRGGLDVHEVWMMDALYMNVDELTPWFRDHEADFLDGKRRMVFLYTAAEKTGERTLQLLGRLARGLTPEDRARALWQGEAPGVAPIEALGHGLVAQQTGVAHERIPPEFLVPLLRTARLPGRAHQGR